MQKLQSLSRGERVARDGAFTSRRGPGEGSVAPRRDQTAGGDGKPSPYTLLARGCWYFFRPRDIHGVSDLSALGFSYFNMVLVQDSGCGLCKLG